MKNNKGSGCGVLVVIIIVIILLAAIFGGGSSSTKKYSSDYNTDRKYRNNVNSVAEIFGENSYDVDRKIQAAADAINNR